MYTYEGQTYRGVTGVLSVIDKSGPLMAWAAKQTATAAVEMYPDTLGGLIATVGEAGAIKALSSRANWQKDEAGDLGTEVHQLADEWMRGIRKVIPDRSKAHVKAYAEWWEASGWKLRTSEAMLVNPTCGYGGTLDLLCYDRDGRTVLADIKTGGRWGRTIYETEILQVAAYAGAEFIQPPSDNVMVPGTAYPMPKVDRCVILHVKPEGVKEWEVSVSTLDWIAWIACLDLATWRDSVKGKRL